jgi:hypothetical protein
MQPVAVGTIVAKNFLAFARVLAASLRQHHPDLPFFVVLADKVDGVFDPRGEPFEVVPIQDLGSDDYRRLSFWYPRSELSITAKPYLLNYLLDRGYAGAIFLDADILVLNTLDRLLQLATTHTVTLTPHLVTPLRSPDRVARELNILQCGVYNGGFIGVSGTADGRRFLAWWKDRLWKHCLHDVRQGFHFDQRWLDLVPTLFDDVYVERDPAYNVAYWNLPERDEAAEARFFHFSGFEPDKPQIVTRYSKGLTMAAMGRAASLFDRYVTLLEGEGHGETKDWPYAFERFDNGVSIPRLARDLYRQLDDETVAAFGDPFDTNGPRNYFAWLNEPVRADAANCQVTRLWDAVYHHRPDLQSAYPDYLGADQPGFLSWIGTFGVREHNVCEAFARVRLKPDTTIGPAACR